jgi:hypothetical protein
MSFFRKSVEKLRTLFKKKSAQLPIPAPITSRVEASPQPQRETKIINIGIDFGTSTTKVGFRDIIEGKSYLLPLNPSATGLQRLMLPTTICIAGPRITLAADGDDAGIAAGRTIRSFKTCVACQAGLGSCRQCEPSLAEVSRGHFWIGSRKVPAEAFAAIYLGYVATAARRFVREHYREQYDLRFTYNIAAPLDHYENNQGRSIFDRLALLTQLLVGRIPQKQISIDAALRCYDAACTLLDKRSGGRNCFVLAEPLAAIICYLNSPAAHEGLHAIVDVGAGTTDISFFRRGAVAGQQTLAFYFCNNYFVGGDRIDSALADEIATAHDLGASRQNIERLVRRAKEATGGQGLHLVWDRKDLVLDADSVVRATTAVCDEIFNAYQYAWKKSYEKEKLESRWKKYNLFTIGGGARFSPLRKRLMDKPWDRIRSVECRQLPKPNDFSVLGEPDRSKALIENFPLFAVCYGVTHHKVDYPEFYTPNQMEALEIPTGPPPKRSWDDYLNQD